MNDYITLRIDITPCSGDTTDLLAAFLCDAGYDSFEPDAGGLSAYIPAANFNMNVVNEILADFPMEVAFRTSHTVVKGQDWNEEWEKNYFKPIVIGGKCVIHSSFHKDIPEAEYDIIVDPKMAFGTGHHSTTSLMLGYILDSDMQGAMVIDMGTGTGILAILAKMRGARKVVGIEIDTPAWENAIENCRLNGEEVEMINGDATKLKADEGADYFFANINRNIITGDLPTYVKSLKSGGTMFLSGFYESDIPVIKAVAEPLGLRIAEQRIQNEWCALRLVKA
ncbi:MAG: 50S ribosomal protein L11 methyltransferase [Bacteroidales bacterium]|nr:50S ribosomal protein L11 methyltransferase [Bacteroidales bacterium]